MTAPHRQHWGRGIANVPTFEGRATARKCCRCHQHRPTAGGKIKGVGTSQQRFTCSGCLRAIAERQAVTA